MLLTCFWLVRDIDPLAVCISSFLGTENWFCSRVCYSVTSRGTVSEWVNQTNIKSSSGSLKTPSWQMSQEQGLQRGWSSHDFCHISLREEPTSYCMLGVNQSKLEKVRQRMPLVQFSQFKWKLIRNPQPLNLWANRFGGGFCHTGGVELCLILF